MSVRIEITNFAEADRQLASIPIELRGPAIKQGLRSAGVLVVEQARRYVPPPGYYGDKPQFKPLRDTIAVEVKGYSRATVAIIGPKRPAGSHGNLVEESHRHFSHGKPTGIMTEATPFMAMAAEDTTYAQTRAIRAGIGKALRHAMR